MIDTFASAPSPLAKLSTLHAQSRLAAKSAAMGKSPTSQNYVMLNAVASQPAEGDASATRSCANAAAHFSTLSLALGLVAVGTTIVHNRSAGHESIPPLFSVGLLLILLAGLGLGIFGVGWNKNPQRGVVLATGILGICVNALCLLVLCGSLKSAANHPPRPTSSIGSAHTFLLHPSHPNVQPRR